MQSIRLPYTRAARTLVLSQRRLLATPPNRPIGIPPVAPPISGAVPVRPVVVTSVPLTPGSSTLADAEVIRPTVVDADLASSEIPPPPPPPPNPKRPRRLFRKFLIYTTVGVLTFYPLSGFLSTKSEAYREFFTGTFPLGDAVADYADEHAWENLGLGTAAKGWQKVTGETPKATGQRVEDKARDVKAGAERGAAQLKNEAELRAAQAKEGLGRGVSKVESAAERARAQAAEAAEKAKAGAKDAAHKVEAAGHDAKVQAKDAAERVKAGVKDAAARTEAGVKDAAAKTEAGVKDAAAKTEAAARDAKSQAKAGLRDAQSKAESVAHDVKVQAQSAADKASAGAENLKNRVVAATQDAAGRAGALARDAKDKVAAATAAIPFNAGDGAEGVVREAESAINKGSAKVSNVIAQAEKNVDNATITPAPASTIYPDTQRPRELRPETVTPAKPTFDGQSKYAGPPLPLGHEPPPGYYLAPPPKPAAEPAAPTLPLLAPKVKDFGTDEPIISQLASTIDSLTTSLSAPGSGPSTDATGILSKAQADLTALSKRIGDIKSAEKVKLEKSLGDKTREFEAELKKAEAGREVSEAGIKEKWEKERAGLVEDWKKNMNKELESQREGIEKRLREEVVSQGIELQRRWLRSIKTQVETERGGRLAKLDDLTSSLKELKTITLDNSATLDQNVRVHKVWSALRAVQAKTESGDLAFDAELRVLRSLNSTETQSATVASAALDQLDASGIATTGVKSLAALSSWFTTSVSPRVQSASLVPAPEDAGVASHLASLTLSKLMFRPTPGPVDGNDVSAVLARAEWCLAEKDLDGAAREVNRLQGWPKRLASDWLREARRALTVRQALDVVATDATLGSLLLV